MINITLGGFDLYLSMFQNLNKNNEGEYYDGIPADISVTDNAEYDFGSMNDESVRAALSIIDGAKIAFSKQRKHFSTNTIKEIESVSNTPELLIRNF